MGGSPKVGTWFTPKMDVGFIENPIQIDNLGLHNVPPFMETPICFMSMMIALLTDLDG